MKPLEGRPWFRPPEVAASETREGETVVKPLEGGTYFLHSRVVDCFYPPEGASDFANSRGTLHSACLPEEQLPLLPLEEACIMPSGGEPSMIELQSNDTFAPHPRGQPIE